MATKTTGTTEKQETTSAANSPPEQDTTPTGLASVDAPVNISTTHLTAEHAPTEGKNISIHPDPDALLEAERANL